MIDLERLYKEEKYDIYTVVEKFLENNADFPIPASRRWGDMVFTDGQHFYKVSVEEKIASRLFKTEQELKFGIIKKVQKVEKVIEYEEWEEV